jgi:predicted lipoprotein with Yx(FWY)xxD motif
MTRHLRLPGRTAAIAVAGLAAAGVLVAGCGSSGYSSNSAATSASSQGAAAVTTGTVAGLGTVLETAQGRVLYIFTPDGTAHVTCTGQCAAAWPPLMTTGSAPAVGGTAKSALVGTLADPSGGSVVTYAGRPLYTYAGDSGPGQATGQGAGGKWYVVTPSGSVKDAS